MLKKVAFLAGVLVMGFAIMMIATQDRTFEVQNAVAVDQPATEIWSVMTEVEKWPAWWPGLQEARLAPDWREGAILDLVLKGTPEKKPARVEKFVAERELVWERPGILGSMTRTSVLLEPAPGGTRISLTSFIEGPQAFLAGFTGKEEFARYHEAVLAALETRLQQTEGI